MVNAFANLYVVGGVFTYAQSDDEAWVLTPCPNCPGQQMAVVAHDSMETQWMRCLSCETAVVRNGWAVSPASRPLRTPQGVPEPELTLWEEARDCLGAGANTATVLLCRKLLLHMAVSKGLPAKNANDRSPTFQQAVDHLETAGVIAQPMKPWVDRIRDVGNMANHEISTIDAKDATDVATFTEQLLRLAYEMEALMARPDLAHQDPAT